MKKTLCTVIFFAFSMFVVHSSGYADQEKRVVEKQVYAFQLSEGQNLDIENINGTIVIETWDQPKLELTVEKSGTGESEEEIKKAMENWDVQIENETNRGISIRVQTKEKEKKGFWHKSQAEVTIDFFVKAPSNINVHASSVNADHINVTGVKGAVKLSNVNGDVKYSGLSPNLACSSVNGEVSAQIDPLPKEAKVSLQTVNGSVAMFLAEPLQSKITAKSLHGEIFSNLDLPQKEMESFVGVTYEHGSESENSTIDLSTINGKIYLLKPGSPLDSGKSLVKRLEPKINIPNVSDLPKTTDVFYKNRENMEQDAQDIEQEVQRVYEEALKNSDALEKTQKSFEKELKIVKKTKKSDDGSDQALISNGSIKGDLQLHEMKGDVEVGDVSGNVSISTYAGQIEIGSIAGNGKLLTYGGDIEVGNVGGTLEAETYGGNIDVDAVKGLLTLKTKGGDIDVNVAESGVIAETLGGEISLKNVQGNVKAETKGGDIQIRITQAPTSGEISLDSLGGDLDLMLPKDINADLNIEMLLHSQQADESYLRTNLKGLNRSVEKKGSDVLVRYQGKIGQGGIPVTLKTRYGRITLMEKGE